MIWGGSYAAVKRAQAVILGAGLLVIRRRIPRLEPGEWTTVVLLGLTGGTAFQLCMVGGLRYTTPAHAALLVALNPVIAALPAAAPWEATS